MLKLSLDHGRRIFANFYRNLTISIGSIDANLKSLDDRDMREQINGLSFVHVYLIGKTIL